MTINKKYLVKEGSKVLIGILLIGIVGISGGLGFVIIAGPNLFGPPPEGPTNLYGLPDDWSTAPNASYLMIYNQTGTSIQVTLNDILEGVSLALEGISCHFWRTALFSTGAVSYCSLKNPGSSFPLII